MKTLLPLCLIAACALADVGLRQGGAYLGPVRDLNCAPDAGIVCARNTAAARGDVACASASTTSKGCLDPSAPQNLGGDKTWTGSQRVVGVAHGSLEACSSGTKGTWQTCTTHNAPVFCNGTTNVELGGTSSAEQVLMSVFVDGIPVGFMGASTLSGSGAVVNAIESTWAAGTTTDGGVLTWRMTDGTNNCDCLVTCNAPTTRTPCAGNCSFASGVTLTPIRLTGGCILDPIAIGNVQVMGVRQ